MLLLPMCLVRGASAGMTFAAVDWIGNVSGNRKRLAP
jgi:hypothetical protein